MLLHQSWGGFGKADPLWDVGTNRRGAVGKGEGPLGLFPEHTEQGAAWKCLGAVRSRPLQRTALAVAAQGFSRRQRSWKSRWKAPDTHARPCSARARPHARPAGRVRTPTDVYRLERVLPGLSDLRSALRGAGGALGSRSGVLAAPGEREGVGGGGGEGGLMMKKSPPSWLLN